MNGKAAIKIFFSLIVILLIVWGGFYYVNTIKDMADDDKEDDNKDKEEDDEKKEEDDEKKEEDDEKKQEDDDKEEEDDSEKDLPIGIDDSKLYYSELYGIYGENKSCNTGDVKLLDDLREDGGGESILLCGKKSSSNIGISSIKVFEDDCPSGWEPSYVYEDGEKTNDIIDAKKGADGGTWRVCYESSTPGSEDIEFKNQGTCGNKKTISHANDDDGPSNDLMKGLGGRDVYVCSN